MGHLLLLDTCVVILHGKILVAKQGFSSLFIHQEEGLHYDRKTTIAETSVEPRQYRQQWAMEIYPYWWE